MTLKQRENQLIKTLSFYQKGKINLDAPAWRTALKTIARVVNTELNMNENETQEFIFDYAASMDKPKTKRTKK